MMRYLKYFQSDYILFRNNGPKTIHHVHADHRSRNCFLYTEIMWMMLPRKITTDYRLSKHAASTVDHRFNMSARHLMYCC